MKVFHLKNRTNKKYSICRFGFPRKVTDIPTLNENARPFQGVPGIQGKLYNLQRTKEEENLNDYNAPIIEAWGGNIDIQFVSAQSSFIVDYVTGYVGKVDKKSSESKQKFCIF